MLLSEDGTRDVRRQFLGAPLAQASMLGNFERLYLTNVVVCPFIRCSGMKNEEQQGGGTS
jgi:hypothetical protein